MLEMSGFGVVLQIITFDVVVMKTFEVCGCVACEVESSPLSLLIDTSIPKSLECFV